ncbi:hypothetical protein [Akkermansia glycaniphila]|nr:hypothetical protein [Akkermansia glycaniphila]
MNTRHTMMLLAASALAPIAYAQPDASSTKPTATLQQMAAVPAASAATVEQRAAKLGTLAMLPADTEIFFSIPNLPGTADRLAQSAWGRLGLKPEDITTAWMDIFDYPREKATGSMDLRSLTISMGANSGKKVAQIMPLLMHAIQAKAQMDSIYIPNPGFSDPDFDKKTEEQQKAAYQQYIDEHCRQERAIMNPVIKEFLQSPLPTAFAIAELPDQAVAKITAGLAAMKEEFAQEISGMKQPYYEGEHAGILWRGVHYQGAEIAQYLQQTESSSNATGFVPCFRDNAAYLSKREAYLLFAIQGNKLLVSVCTDPAKEIKIAKTPQESILATNKVAFADPVLDKTPDILFFIDKSFSDALPSVLDRLDLSHGTLNQFKLMQAAPISGLMWQDKGIHLELAYGQDKSFDPARPLKLASMADLPSTILYTESINTKEAIDASLAEIGSYIQELAQSMALPAINTFWHGIETSAGGLDGDSALIIDNQGHLPAELMPGTDIEKLEVPRMAAYFGISNKATITAGWEEILKAYDSLKPMGLQIPDQFLPYCAMVQADLSDKQLVISASQTLNKQISETAANATGTLKGGAFVLRLAPVKSMLDKGAPMLQSMHFPIPIGEINMLDSLFDGIYGTITPSSKDTRIHLYIKEK